MTLPAIRGTRLLGFAGTVVVDPGLTLVSRWRPGPGIEVPPDDQVACYGGVAVKRGLM